MTKLSASFSPTPERPSGPFQLLWTIFCWATAFSAVVVTTAVLAR